MYAAEGGAVRALVDLFVERVPVEAVADAVAARRELLLVTIDDQADRLAGLCAAIESEGVVVELTSMAKIHDFMNPDVLTLVVDDSCDGPYRELATGELRARFPNSPLRVVDLAGGESQPGVISFDLPARRFGRTPNRQLAAAVRPLLAQLLASE